MKKRRQARVSRTFIAVSVCIAVSVTVASLYLKSKAGHTSPQAKWESISSVRVDFGAMVTNRSFIVGAEGDPVRAELTLKEMYFYKNDFILPFRGKMSCSKGTTECSMEVRAPVRFEAGRIYAGELGLGAFASHGLDLGQDGKFVVATLFTQLKDKIEIRPLEVDGSFKSIHSINNDFIEFEK